MTTRYRGTCIGGVADGHWLERDDAEIRIDKLSKRVDAKPGELDHTVYKFLLLLGNSNAEIGCWAPVTLSIEQVIARLVRCYNPRTGLLGELVPNTLPIKHG